MFLHLETQGTETGFWIFLQTSRPCRGAGVSGWCLGKIFFRDVGVFINRMGFGGLSYKYTICI